MTENAMNANRWQRTHELFDAALQLPPERRAAFLASACGGDAALKTEVESLLEHDTKADAEFLAPPARGEEDFLMPPMMIPSPQPSPHRGEGEKQPFSPPRGEGEQPPLPHRERDGVRVSASQKTADLEAVSPNKASSESTGAGMNFSAPPGFDPDDSEPNNSDPNGPAPHDAGAPGPHPQIPDPFAPDPLLGAHIGRYHIKAVIAAGGMATVYEAVQQEPHRVVALKVLNRRAASKSALRRFQFEAQILARLRHRNIAQVFEAGVHRLEAGATDSIHQLEAGATNSGIPYIAMEYIPGAQPLTDYARQKNLDVRTRLELFAKVCDAVQHGHQKGIIHRDLKPANLLVDSAGEPKVIDFGVARALDSDMALTTQQTHFGQLVGTVQYMSPEQCGGDPHDLDTRSDVYALGVVLHELLAGEPPYDATTTTIYKAMQTIREQPPRRLSEVNQAGGTGVPARGGADISGSAGVPARSGGVPARELRGDLEIITLKTLEKDRDRRYASAADLAADLRRHLNREPIAAKPPTMWTRAVRWVQRHPIIATTTICLCIAAFILGGTFLSVWTFNRQPYRIWISPDRSEAQLLTRIGGMLWSWRTDHADGILFAELIERPVTQGGGHLAIVGFGAHVLDFAGNLCAFDVSSNPTRPHLLWRRSMETKNIPAWLQLRGHGAHRFTISNTACFDIFPEIDGAPACKEIVVAFRNGSNSQDALRIYDLCGELLYEVWQDGGLSDLYWMADAGLLVCSGFNAEDYSLCKDRTDQPLPPGATQVPVVFALKPQRGDTALKWIRAPADADIYADSVVPEWYYCLMPEIIWPPRTQPFHFRLPPAEYPRGTHVQIEIKLGEAFDASASAIFGSVGITLNADGKEIGQRIISDQYAEFKEKCDWAPRDARDAKVIRLDQVPPLKMLRAKRLTDNDVNEWQAPPLKQKP